MTHKFLDTHCQVFFNNFVSYISTTGRTGIWTPNGHRHLIMSFTNHMTQPFCQSSPAASAAIPIWQTHSSNPLVHPLDQLLDQPFIRLLIQPRLRALSITGRHHAHGYYGHDSTFILYWNFSELT